MSTPLSAAQHDAQTYITTHKASISDWTAQLFDLAEPAWREYRSAEWYIAKLRAEGFTVEEGSAGMPTAFCADWQNGDGPIIGTYAEYDAVPGNCQAPVPYRAPRDNLSVHASGHTDPHSALGISGLAGLLATKAAMEKHGIKGGLRFTGEPAEKVRGSKPIHAAAGYYDGLAAILSFHPFYMLPLCNTVRWDTHCGAAYAMIYRFICDTPEDWSIADGAPIPQNHSAARAPGANDALNMMYLASKSLREAMLPHQGGWSVSEAILTAGQATADNLPAGLADIQYMIRTPTLAMAEQVTRVLDRNAKTAAEMTGCRFERHWVCKSRPGLANHAIAGTVWDVMQTVGAPVWDQSATQVAQQIQTALGLPPMQDPFIPELSTLLAPQEAEALLRQDLAPSQTHATSDDYTDMTWHAPTARFYVARPALKAHKGKVYPAWVMNALGGIPETIDPMVQTAAQILALSALRLLEDKTARDDAMSEFETRRAQDPIPPLCDYTPPIHFRWPEYITTPRGRDWWIPSTPHEA
jgi:aminobenzoyl-glutamate utilization protein B